MRERARLGARVKKLQWHSTFGEIAVEEVQYRHGSKRIRPFVNQAKVCHRGCSRPLQRVVTDFGADVAFAQVEDKLVEHFYHVCDHLSAAAAAIRAGAEMAKAWLNQQKE